MAKIVIDGRMINESGIGRYLRNLIENLKKIDKRNSYFILLPPEYSGEASKDNFKNVLVNSRWYTIEEQIKLPKILNELQPDLVHFPHFNVPILYKGKFVVTIHDLIHQHYAISDSSTHGQLIFKLKKFGYKKVFNTAVKKSVKVIVPSEYVKQQLIDEWRIENRKILVTPEGVDDNLLGKAGKLPEEVSKPFILYVGNAHPHKNVEGLIKAFRILKKFQDDGLRLVLVGKENYFWKKMMMDSSFLENDIIYTGYVSDEELVALYKKAEAYVEPSFEEGFGLPLLEAFSLGCPVVASDIGSLREVGGEAALYFNPNNIDDMVDKITEVLNSEKLQNELVEKGKKRVKEFSWKKMAQQTLGVYQHLLV